VGPNGAYLSPRDPHRGMQPARGRDLSSRWTVHVACQLSFSMVPAPQVPRRHLGCRPQVPRRHLRCRPQVPRRHLRCRPQVPRRHVPGAAERHPRCRGGTPGAAAAPQVPRRHLGCRGAAARVPPRHLGPAPQVPPRHLGCRGAAPQVPPRHPKLARPPCQHRALCASPALMSSSLDEPTRRLLPRYARGTLEM